MKFIDFTKYFTLPSVGAVFVFTIFSLATCESVDAQDKVVYCKHGQTGRIITIEAGHACPFGYYRI